MLLTIYRYGITKICKIYTGVMKNATGVYFGQRTGALHVVHCLKSSFYVIMKTYLNSLLDSYTTLHCILIQIYPREWSVILLIFTSQCIGHAHTGNYIPLTCSLIRWCTEHWWNIQMYILGRSKKLYEQKWFLFPSPVKVFFLG